MICLKFVQNVLNFQRYEALTRLNLNLITFYNPFLKIKIHIMQLIKDKLQQLMHDM